MKINHIISDMYSKMTITIHHSCTDNPNHLILRQHFGLCKNWAPPRDIPISEHHTPREIIVLPWSPASMTVEYQSAKSLLMQWMWHSPKLPSMPSLPKQPAFVLHSSISKPHPFLHRGCIHQIVKWRPCCILAHEIMSKDNHNGTVSIA